MTPSARAVSSNTSSRCSPVRESLVSSAERRSKNPVSPGAVLISARPVNLKAVYKKPLALFEKLRVGVGEFLGASVALLGLFVPVAGIGEGVLGLIAVLG